MVHQVSIDNGVSRWQSCGVVVDARIEKRGKTANVAPDVRGPQWVVVTAQLPERPEITVRVRADAVGGIYLVTNVTMEAEPGHGIATEDLRGVPLRALLRRPLRSLLSTIALKHRLLARPDEDEGTRMHRLVALEYRIARAVGDAPTQQVQQAFHVSRATAARRVSSARVAGFLGADEVGAAGGARSDWDD
ncbi:MAG: DUF6214 family protein [Jatrophihabitans sp.]